MNEVTDVVDMESLWSECLKILENSLERPTFETCLKETHPLSFEKNIFTIGVSPFAKNWLKKKSNCRELITEALQSLSGKKMSLHIVAVERGDHAPPSDHALPQKSEKPAPIEPEPKEHGNPHNGNSTLNPRYTFETFIIGDSNHLASAACRAVSESPGGGYNPLFIYGGVGLGKTHLLHAIGNKVSRDNHQNKKLKIVYVTSERFTFELINSLGERQMVQFKEKYRSVDVLLIDDIQFLINKERTQEEFFYTFNELYEAQKQIVITSDRPPKEIPTLHDRLRSRFEWGLIADIFSPDTETREAILRKKAEMEKTPVPVDVISFIATKIPSNIRELEGALIRVIAYSSIHKKEITRELAEEALKGILPDSKDRLMTPEIIQKKVSDYFGVKVSDITSVKRDQRFSYPRHIAMFLSKELTSLSLPDTAKAFGKKDHSTVIHACRKIATLIEEEPSTRQNIENIKNLLKG
jgi:chromosomal replication initiator protein